eukprot:GHVU01052270.1.p1 GENE.GHVU01052270.1~~GHVU01052270.1.p1  ORF type:complete len:114 (+),score=5.38 GHVU01052270.1:48-389(+)
MILAQFAATGSGVHMYMIPTSRVTVEELKSMPRHLKAAIAVTQILVVSHSLSSSMECIYASSVVALVIAHPDDESMFFGPFPARAASRCHRLHILSLSNGARGCACVCVCSPV